MSQIGEVTSPAQSIKAQTLAAAATTTGAAVDCTGFGEVTWIFDAGTFTGAGCTATVTIEESATSGGTYAAIAGAAFAAVNSANHQATYLGRARVNPAKPFQHAVCVASGTVTTAPIAVLALRHEPNKLAPVHTPSFAAI